MSKQNQDDTLVSLKPVRCLRCGYVWMPKVKFFDGGSAAKMISPVVCAKCRSPYWHIPKKLRKGSKMRLYEANEK